MRISKRIAITLSGLALAGSAGLTLGATAASAQTPATATPSHVVTQWGWGWGDGWGGGWDDGWGWDDCWC